MSVITRLRKARPYLTAPFSDDGDTPLSPDRMSGIPSSPIVNQPDQQLAQSIAPRPQLMQSQTADTPAVPDLSATDYYQGNRNIRPKMDATIRDPQARLSDYESNLINYEPQKEGAGKIIGRAALGFLTGGIPGAAYTAGSDLLDRKALDRNWQQGQIQNTERMIGRLNTERRAGLQDQLIRSETLKNTAEANKTPAISQSRHKIAVPDDRYKQFGINANDKVWADSSGAPLMQDGQPVLADRAPVNPSTNLDRNVGNQIVRKNPDGSYAPVYTAPDKPQPEIPDVAAQNAPDIKGLQERIAGYQSELDQHIGEVAKKKGAIKKQAETAYQSAFKTWNDAATLYNNGKGPQPGPRPKRKDFYDEAQNNDPDYLSGDFDKVTNRVKELQDAIKDEKKNLEGLQTESRRAAQKPRKVSSTFKPASDGKYHYTEAQIRANLNGKTYEETVAHLKSLPNVVIDQ